MRWWDTCTVQSLYSLPTPDTITTVAIALSPPCSSSVVPPSVLQGWSSKKKNKAARILARSVWVVLSLPSDLTAALLRDIFESACTWDEVWSDTYLPKICICIWLWIVDGENYETWDEISEATRSSGHLFMKFTTDFVSVIDFVFVTDFVSVFFWTFWQWTVYNHNLPPPLRWKLVPYNHHGYHNLCFPEIRCSHPRFVSIPYSFIHPQLAPTSQEHNSTFKQFRSNSNGRPPRFPRLRR